MKKVIFALFAVVIAVGGSAFTNATVTDVFYGSSPADQFNLIPGAYNDVNCQNTSPRQCAYKVTPAGSGIVIEPTYTDEEMAEFLLDGLIVAAEGSKTGLYIAP